MSWFQTERFTWKEGLVLVGLAYLLAALLFPTVSRARPAARLASCQSNQKQLATALGLYAADFDGCLPPAEGWKTALHPYAKSPWIQRCPSDARKEPLWGSYAFNRYLSGAPLDRLPSPAELPLLFDAEPSNPEAASTGGDFTARHEGRGVLAFADGHVKRMPGEYHLRLEPVALMPQSERTQ